MSRWRRLLGLESTTTPAATEQRATAVAPSRFAAFLGLGTKAGVSVSVEEGLAHLVASAPDALPDVIFVDISMPILSGFDLLDTVQQDHPELHQTLLEGSRLFLLTSSVNPRDMERAGAYPLISKVLANPSLDVLKTLALKRASEGAGI